MALVILANDKKQHIDHDQSIELWRILNGEREATDVEEKYCMNVKRLYLNWHEAPDSYIKKYFDNIVQLHFGSWMCDKQGRLVYPDYTRYEAINFAKKWELIANGKITDIGKYHLRQYYASQRYVQPVINVGEKQELQSRLPYKD